MRVLIVSEDPTERLRASSALTLHADVEIVEATSGEETRRRLLDGELDVDVMVVDADLYPRGGYALLYDLHAQADLAGRTLPPSVVLTVREPDRFLVDWSRADASLHKPTDPFVLARTIDELVGRASWTTAEGAPA